MSWKTVVSFDGAQTSHREFVLENGCFIRRSTNVATANVKVRVGGVVVAGPDTTDLHNTEHFVPRRVIILRESASQFRGNAFLRRVLATSYPFLESESRMVGTLGIHAAAPEKRAAIRPLCLAVASQHSSAVLPKWISI